MRRIRVIFTTVGTVPALAVALLPACGTISAPQAPTASDASEDASVDDADLFGDITSFDANAPETAPSKCGGWGASVHTVEVPPPGTVADPGQICAVTQPPVESNKSARVLFQTYSTSTQSGAGYIAVPSVIQATIVGLPTVSVLSASDPKLGAFQVSNMKSVSGGYTFDYQFTNPVNQGPFLQLMMKTAFTIQCADAATQMVEAITKIELCQGFDTLEWVSSGDACTICQVIAEMAPSPIVSDNRGDDLPLGRVIRIRVIEVARAGRDVLLFAENDGGDATEYEWHVSGGKLTQVDRDLVLWTMPDEGGSDPFGQVAVWNDDGAVVENFLFGAA